MPIERAIIVAVILAAIVAVALIAITQMGIVVPGFVISIGWVLVVAFIAVAAIRFLMRM
jgi:hypothetical protein